MTLKTLVEKYKGTIEFVVKKVVEGEAVEIVSFHNTELSAIKDEILDKNVVRYTAVLPAKTMNPIVKIEVVVEEPEEITDP